MSPKVMLVSCNLCEEPFPVYPLGVATLADALRRDGVQVFEWDMLLDPDGLGGRVRELAPDLVGVSIRNIDNVSLMGEKIYHDEYRAVVRTLRQNSSCPVVLGGSGFSIFPEEIMGETGADYGVVGEGDAALPELVHALASGKAPPRGLFRPGRRADPARTSACGRDKAACERYLASGGMLNIQTKRGCPHNCAYCSYPLIEGRELRLRPPEAVVDEMESLASLCGADYFFMTDSVFNDASGHWLRVAEEIVRRGLRTSWMCYMRPSKFSSDEVGLLATSGLRAVEWGADCASDETLERMGKGFLWKDVADSAGLFSSRGIACAIHVAFGGPGETHGTLDEGLRNIGRLGKCVVFASIGYRIHPGTPLFNIALEVGIIQKGRNLIEPVFYVSPDVELRRLQDSVRDAFCGDRLRICSWDERNRMTVKHFHSKGRRGPVWDLLLEN